MLLPKAGPWLHRQACSVTREVWFHVAWEWSVVAVSFFNAKSKTCLSHASVSDDCLPGLSFVVDPTCMERVKINKAVLLTTLIKVQGTSWRPPGTAFAWALWVVVLISLLYVMKTNNNINTIVHTAGVLLLPSLKLTPGLQFIFVLCLGSWWLSQAYFTGIGTVFNNAISVMLIPLGSPLTTPLMYKGPEVTFSPLLIFHAYWRKWWSPVAQDWMPPGRRMVIFHGWAQFRQ